MDGWILSKGYRMGVGEIVRPLRVEEPAGYEGERLTPAGQVYKKPEHKFTISRDGRTVYKTKREAAEAQ